MQEVLKVLKERRSIRKYTKELVSKEVLEQILEAGMYAANGKNCQAASMVVTQNPELIAKLSKLNAQVMGTDTDPFYGAPTVVMVFADPERPTWLQDGSLVMGNLMNAAHALGVDSCWINRATEVFDSEEGKALMRDWGIDERLRGVGNCILGYRDCEYPKAKPRKENFVTWVD
ncbi:MAG: nitroreductase family protein [Lachnospiraceae bacterium]|jgi:nitroreductase